MCSMDKMEAGTISSQDADARSASSVPTGNPSGTQRSSISPELSSKLTTVSFFAAVGVVLIHAHPPFSQAGQSDLSLLFERFLSGPFTSSAVPIFFVISGYLLAVKTDFGQQPHWYSLTIKKRIKSLLVPYILWNIIHVLTISLVKMLENIHAGRPMLLYTGLYEPLLSFGNLVRIFGLDLGKPPIEGVLWFVRNLLILFLISPLFMFFMKRRRTAFFFLLFLLVAEGIISYFITLNHGKLWAGCRLESLLFFSLGMYLAFYPVPHAISRAFRLVLPVFWLTIAFTAALHFPYKHLAITRILFWLTTLTGVGAIWLLPDLFPALRRIGKWSIAKDSFFLYVFHCIILVIFLSPSVENALGQKLHIPVFGIFCLRFLIPLIFSLLTAEALKRFLPKVYRILVGGR